MAAHSLSKLPTTISALTHNHRTKPDSRPNSLLSPWLGANSLSLPPSSLRVRTQESKLHPFSATVCLSLPTANEGIVSSTEKVPKWSWRAIKSFAMGELEARKLKFATTGTEAILMGILIEGTSLAAKFLRVNGITLTKVREETIKLLGKADMWFFSPEHPALTEEAQRVLDWAVDKKKKSGNSGEITTSHLLLGIWYEGESPGHKILAGLGFNEEKAKELESLSTKPGFIDG
ncbi:ATP-dependent Clp protease ATP-binding subunit CLPT2, chloroplastic-like [Pyrus communis]|uniref:ATP-dependent Clp protease ATP-binding subunit CLPT2, chloroplastic-like n=1 Tax=Pyrus communis TaxID=23211 RepID=UPI0035C108AA